MSILQGLIAADQYNQNREALNLEKKKRDQELAIHGYDPETLAIKPGTEADLKQKQIDQALQLATALQGKLAAQDTDNALLDFAQTGDASHLQGVLDKNPYVKQAWNARGVLNVSNIDFSNDKDILARKGFNEAEYDTTEKQDILKRNIYKFYDGKEWNVGLLNNVAKETGAFSRLGSNKSQIITDNHQEMRDFLAGPRSSANTAEGHKYESDIMSASEETGVPPNLIAAMMNQESSNDPNAKSSKGARGLMQLMPDTAKELGVTDIANPTQNIKAGAKYMAKLLNKYNGDTRLALAAYNAGPGNVEKYNGIPPFAETTQYVDKIMNNYAAGESYYTPGNDAIAAGQQFGSKPSLSAMGEEMNRRADNRIAVIQNFNRSNANAEKGTTNANVDIGVETEAAKARAALIANKVKLATEGNTAAQKDLAAADEQEKLLVSDFGGEDGFFKTDFGDNTNFNKAWPKVVKINKLQGTELKAEDKKNVTEVRSLITVADPASKISAKQTGFIDNTLKDVFSYMSDDANGADKTAAMAVFRSSLRNALYGSTLTDGEIKSFDEAYGNNNQKLGPVLEKYKVALSQVNSKLDSVARMGNPYTMHVLLGADQKKLANIQAALQQRIDFVEGRINPNGSKITAKNENVSYEKPPTVNSATFINKEARPSLSSIFGGGS